MFLLEKFKILHTWPLISTSSTAVTACTHHGRPFLLLHAVCHGAFAEEPLQRRQGSVGLGHFLVGAGPLKLLPVDLHLHNEALVVAPARLRDELVFEAAALLVQLHDGVLPVFGEDWPLLPRSLISRGEKVLLFFIKDIFFVFILS